MAASAKTRADELSRENDALQIRLHELESWLADWLEEKALLTEELAKSQANVLKWVECATTFLNNEKHSNHVIEVESCELEEGLSGRRESVINFSPEEFFVMLDQRLKETREICRQAEWQMNRTANQQLQTLAGETLQLISETRELLSDDPEGLPGLVTTVQNQGALFAAVKELESEAQLLRAQTSRAAEKRDSEDKIMDKVLSLTEKLEEAETRGNGAERRTLELEVWVEAWLQEKALLEESLQRAFKTEQLLKLDLATTEAKLSQVLTECDRLTDSTLNLFHVFNSRWRVCQVACIAIGENAHEASELSLSLKQNLEQSQNEFSQLLCTVASL